MSDIPEGYGMDDELNDLEQGLNESAASFLSEKFTENEGKEFIRWMMGAISDAPELVKSIINERRLLTGTAYVMVQTLMRLQVRNQWILRAEAKVFNAALLDTMSVADESFQNLFKIAVDSQTRDLEFMRKFWAQNPDMLKAASDIDPEVSELYELLLTLPKSKLAKIKEAVTAP